MLMCPFPIEGHKIPDLWKVFIEIIV
jgi:hypothetical protein